MPDPKPQTPAQPVGAAAFADPSKVTAVPVDTSTPAVDASLLNRGAPGTGYRPGGPKPSGPGQASEPDRSKLPKDEHGNPRNLTLAEAKAIKESVIAELRKIFDPEIPVNIYELGMVYNVSMTLVGEAQIKMTLTSPACPVAGSLPGEVQGKIAVLPGVVSARVDLVWDPPWSKSMMSEAAKLELNVM